MKFTQEDCPVCHFPVYVAFIGGSNRIGKGRTTRFFVDWCLCDLIHTGGD